MPFWPLLALESTATAVDVEKVEPVEPQEHDHKKREQPPAVVHRQTGASDEAQELHFCRHLPSEQPMFDAPRGAYFPISEPRGTSLLAAWRTVHSGSKGQLGAAIEVFQRPAR